MTFGNPLVLIAFTLMFGITYLSVRSTRKAWPKRGVSFIGGVSVVVTVILAAASLASASADHRPLGSANAAVALLTAALFTVLIVTAPFYWKARGFDRS